MLTLGNLMGASAVFWDQAIYMFLQSNIMLSYIVYYEKRECNCILLFLLFCEIVNM